MEQPAKARLSSVANSIRLLTSFSGEEDELGVTTLASRLRLAKSTVHRLATTLTGAGFLEQNSETGKYRLGVVSGYTNTHELDRMIARGEIFTEAVADDATAASWNPGGLSQLERPEISLALERLRQDERMGADATPGAFQCRTVVGSG